MRSFRKHLAGRLLALGLAMLVSSSISLSAQATNAQSQQINRTAESQQADKIDPITHEGYILPPEPILSLVDAPRNSNVLYGNAQPGARKYFLRALSEPMPPLAQFGAPHYNIAGWQIDATGNRARNMTGRSLYAIELLDWNAGKTINVEFPANTRAFGPSWSTDGSAVGFFVNFENATHIYLADPATGKSRPLTTRSVLATNVTNFYWTGDGKSIITVLVPEGRGAEPKPPRVAMEPMVRVNENTTLRTRTIFDLLQNPYEKELLEYHMTGQLAVIDLKSRAIRKVGEPGMIRSINASPDGMFFRVTYLDKPFSYFQALNSWGTHEVLIDGTGKVIRELARRTLRDGTQNDPDPVDPTDPTDPTDPNDPNPTDPAPTTGRGARQGGAQGRGGRAGGDAAAQGPQAPDTSRRSVAWHPYEKGQMFFQRSRVAGDTSRFVDRFMIMPDLADTMAVRVIYETPNTIQAVRFSDNGRILFVAESPPATARGGGAGAPAQGGRAGAGAPARGGGAQPGRGGATPGGGGAGLVTEYAVFLDENSAKVTVIAPQAGRGGAGPAAAPAGGGGGGRQGRGGGGGGGPASPYVMKAGSRGNSVVMISSDGKFVYRQGTGRYLQDTSRTGPYVEKIEIRTGTASRIYESNSPIGESIDMPLDDDFGKILVRRGSSSVVTNSFIVDTRTREAKQLTNNRDLWPNFQTRTITTTARRGDGVPIRVRVTVPQDYVEGTKLPALFWFYPREFDSTEAYTSTLNGRGGGGGGGNRGGGAGGGGGAPGLRTLGVRSMSLVTAVGYALVEPDAPIIGGDGIRPNDNYVRDLREGLTAVVNHLDSLNYIDRHRLAIGGHSYGGFSTVNAMVHTTLFKAGIAGDGNYNRTLTPNGFQNERRDLWQGRETYLAMSPFLYANQLTGALLLYHSMEDQNVGTDPINSPKLFHALQGLGKTVAMYMYPYEDHGPVARETVLDQWARWIAWLDKYVKGAKIVMQ